jgi:hypothetical protein
MLIKIESDVFNSSEVFTDLRRLLSIASYKYRYDVFIEVQEVQSTEQYERLHQDDKIWVEEQFIRHIEQSNTPDYTVALNSAVSVFSLEEAIRFFHQELFIIIEHSENDAHILEALFKNFKKLSKKIVRHQKNGWVSPSMGGGTGIEAAIRSRLDLFKDLPKENHHYLRCFVLTDSDKKHPNMPLDTGKQNLITFLEERNIPYHILEKREMENYLPDEAFDEIEDNEEFIAAYKDLTPQQKDYLDIENGFGGKNLASLNENIQALYEDIKFDSTPLRSGIIYNDFKKEFPKLFRNKTVTQATLLAKTQHQTNPNELQDIITKISQLL